MQLPLFTLSNYSDIMSASYADNQGQKRTNFRDLLDVLQRSFLQKFSLVDARQLSQYVSNHQLNEPFQLGAQSYSLAQILTTAKLALPTIHACDYFFWNQSIGKHRGVDLMAPIGTPIPSFTTGTVTRIKTRDGLSNNEGNCIVIETNDNYFICYEHLDSINVQLGDIVNQSSILGTCGDTGNATQYHLHLQVDTQRAPFHPYRHAEAIHMDSYTIDPLVYLRNRHPDSPFIDLPLIAAQQEAILRLAEKGIIKGFDKKCFPEQYLQRYEMALLIDRTLQQENIYATLPIKQPNWQAYQDIHIDDPELDQALRRLQKYGIMKGHNNAFYPHQHLKGEELLALLGRIFFNLSDADQETRRQPYLDKFIEELLIFSNRGYIRHAIPRKEVFTLLRKLLKE